MYGKPSADEQEIARLTAALAEKDREIERLKAADRAYYEVARLNDMLRAEIACCPDRTHKRREP